MHVAGMLGMPRRIYTYDARPRLGHLEPADAPSGRCMQVPSYRDFRVQPGRVAAERQAGRRRSLGRLDAGVGDDLAAAVIQLRDDPEVRSRRPLWDLKHPDDPDWKYE